MPADPNRVRDVFLAAVELSPEQRPGFLADACGGDAELRAEVDRLLVANSNPDSILEPASPTTADAAVAFVAGDPGTVDLPGRTSATARSTPSLRADDHRDRRVPTGRGRRGRSTTPILMPPRLRGPRPSRPRGRGPDGQGDRHRHRRPVHAARGHRRGGHGHRLPGRASRTGQAAGGAQADQDRHGLACGAGPVRRRAAGPGDDGPPQHRPHLRWRRHNGRPAVLRHGAGAGACRSPSTATRSGSRCRPGWSCSWPFARRCSTPTRRGSSTAT